MVDKAGRKRRKGRIGEGHAFENRRLVSFIELVDW